MSLRSLLPPWKSRCRLILSGTLATAGLYFALSFINDIPERTFQEGNFESVCLYSMVMDHKAAYSMPMASYLIPYLGMIDPGLKFLSAAVFALAVGALLLACGMALRSVCVGLFAALLFFLACGRIEMLWPYYYPETILFTIASALTVYGLILREEYPERTCRGELLAAVPIGISFFIKSPLFLLPPLLAAWDIFSGKLKRGQTGWRQLLTLVLVPYLFLAPWVYMNLSAYGQFRLFERQRADDNIISGALGTVHTGERMCQLVGLDLDGPVASWALRQTLGHPLRYLGSFLQRIYTVFLWWPALCTLFMLAVVRWRRSPKMRMAAIFAAYYVLLHCLLSVEIRYFYPMLPVLLLGAAALAALKPASPPRRTPLWGYAALLACMLAPYLLSSWKLLVYPSRAVTMEKALETGAFERPGLWKEAVNAAARAELDRGNADGALRLARLARKDRKALLQDNTLFYAYAAKGINIEIIFRCDAFTEECVSVQAANALAQGRTRKALDLLARMAVRSTPSLNVYAQENELQTYTYHLRLNETGAAGQLLEAYSGKLPPRLREKLWDELENPANWAAGAGDDFLAGFYDYLNGGLLRLRRMYALPLKAPHEQAALDRETAEAAALLCSVAKPGAPRQTGSSQAPASLEREEALKLLLRQGKSDWGLESISSGGRDAKLLAETLAGELAAHPGAGCGAALSRLLALMSEQEVLDEISRLNEKQQFAAKVELSGAWLRRGESREIRAALVRGLLEQGLPEQALREAAKLDPQDPGLAALARRETLSTNDSREKFARLSKLYERRNYPELEKTAAEYLQKYPFDNRARELYAEALVTLDKPAQAAAEILAAAHDDIPGPRLELLKLLANGAYEKAAALGSMRGADENFKRLKELAIVRAVKEEADVCLRHGRCATSIPAEEMLLVLERTSTLQSGSEAAELGKSYLLLNPEPKMILAVAVLLERAKRPLESADELEKIWKTDQADERIRSFGTVLLSGENARNRREKLASLLNGKYYLEAATAAEDYLRDYPFDAAAQLMLCEALLKGDEKERAAGCYEQSRRLTPQNPEETRLAEAGNLLAAGEYAAALQQCANAAHCTLLAETEIRARLSECARRDRSARAPSHGEALTRAYAIMSVDAPYRKAYPARRRERTEDAGHGRNREDCHACEAALEAGYSLLRKGEKSAGLRKLLMETALSIYDAGKIKQLMENARGTGQEYYSLVALALNSRHVRSRYARLSALQAKGQGEDLLQTGLDYLRDYPFDPRAIRLVGTELLWRGKDEEARQIFAKASSCPAQAGSLLAAGDTRKGLEKARQCGEIGRDLLELALLRSFTSEETTREAGNKDLRIQTRGILLAQAERMGCPSIAAMNRYLRVWPDTEVRKLRAARLRACGQESESLREELALWCDGKLDESPQTLTLAEDRARLSAVEQLCARNGYAECAGQAKQYADARPLDGAARAMAMKAFLISGQYDKAEEFFDASPCACGKRTSAQWQAIHAQDYLQLERELFDAGEFKADSRLLLLMSGAGQEASGEILPRIKCLLGSKAIGLRYKKLEVLNTRGEYKTLAAEAASYLEDYPVDARARLLLATALLITGDHNGAKAALDAAASLPLDDGEKKWLRQLADNLHKEESKPA